MSQQDTEFYYSDVRSDAPPLCSAFLDQIATIEERVSPLPRFRFPVWLAFLETRHKVPPLPEPPPESPSCSQAVCWGDNAYGQATPPSGGTGAAGARSWRQIAAGHYHSCGVLKEGGLECWGSSVYGATDVPADVTTWASVAVGRFHTCGVTYDGSMRCWGATQDGATVPPADVPLWTGVTAGLFHSCGVAPDGVGHCWGRSVYGMTKVPDFRWRSSSSATLQGTFI